MTGTTFSLRTLMTTAGLVLSLGLAVAQAPAPIPAPAAPAAPNLPASHLALAMDVVKSSGMSRSIDGLVPLTVDKARQLFVSMRPELAGEIDKSIKALQPEFDTQKEEGMKIASYGFANRLGEAELKDINAFFSSTVGKKFVESQPAILDEMFRNLDVFTERLGQFVVDKLRDDMKKKGHAL